MISKVSIVQCKTYELESIYDSIQLVLEKLGGINQFVQKGQKVLLKPNMLRAGRPEQGVTTHPNIVESVTKLVQSAGAEVWIGDSPSVAIKGIHRYWEKTGFLKVAERTGAQLVNFEAGGTTARDIEEYVFHFAKAVFEADVIINLPKLKTHGLTLFTGAIKNLYGTLPGFQKGSFHKKYPHPEKFSRMLCSLYSLLKPRIHIMDAVVAMAGNGPATGELRHTGLILASSDGVALDTVATSLAGFKPGEVDAIRIAHSMGLGEGSPDRIDLSGEELDTLRFKDFPLPSNHLSKLVPEFLVHWMGRFVWIRPRVQKDKCVGCEVCAENCPVKAIEMVAGYPVMDYKTCINCLCCNESCPESAIFQQLSWLARRFGGS